MYRPSLRSVLGQALQVSRSQAFRSAPRRFASTAAPADRPRSWKSSGLRWALAIGAVYYYNTSSVFAEETAEATQSTAAPPSFSESDLPTVDYVIEQKRKQLKTKADQEEQGQADSTADSASAAAKKTKQPAAESQHRAVSESPEMLEEEAGQQGAFNPETGEINWDCPCLGGMATGPCGEEFKTAFSCFVYSTEEPKGMDCIDKFQGMQECFRKYPDIYGAELADDEYGGEATAEGHDAPRQDELETNTLPGTKKSPQGGVPQEGEDTAGAVEKAAHEEQPPKKAEDEKKE
ncbi:uncharacterized protein UV8b_00588 [Ustilaginoidea virens]|uniref:Mitochondrial intermembrane space import and assembly protein 40 n=1 Tax=Ustilaginoidea virens TaxID=1159556 RepID=A0A8E5HJD3_USTVR|nr:uncharacterized protein UV8b_00588 [Ustilaginoidea virens]QUC16347.1 hypothetical protein UV8b_00588 [Ustilaginoidea virens]